MVAMWKCCERRGATNCGADLFRWRNSMLLKMLSEQCHHQSHVSSHAYVPLQISFVLNHSAARVTRHFQVHLTAVAYMLYDASPSSSSKRTPSHTHHMLAKWSWQHLASACTPLLIPNASSTPSRSRRLFWQSSQGNCADSFAFFALSRWYLLTCFLFASFQFCFSVFKCSLGVSFHSFCFAFTSSL
jgi:hypothetical protein